ncbi:hypothetical protein [Corynebacterium diphtheriae]|uniref:hypothetical protein n=1 Tax=Corynebacterium diphtheriae TaxID=1717 RepID=UPI0015F35D69|nr:hypothetical protein [Corynebacterium diphtheriae]MBG9343711.1 hypothetical protein [Corynebacterium diphtheriae]
MNAWGVPDNTAFADHHKMEFFANVINVMRGVARHENVLKIACKVPLAAYMQKVLCRKPLGSLRNT